MSVFEKEYEITKWQDFSESVFSFAKLLTQSTGRGTCRLWKLGDYGAVPLIPKNTAGALWLGWQRPRQGHACMIELNGAAVCLAKIINEQRVDLMSDILTADPQVREAVVREKYKVSFSYLVKPIAWFENPVSVSLKKSDLSAENYVFRVGSDDDYQECLASDEVLFYVGKQPDIRVFS